MASNNTLMDIKRVLDAHLGERIVLKANRGRRKMVERTGILESTYPSIFIVKLDEKLHSFDRVSYSYADVLTETVTLTVCPKGSEEFEITFNQ